MAASTLDKGYGLDLRAHEGLLRELLGPLVRVSHVDAAGEYTGFASGRTVTSTLTGEVYRAYAASRPRAGAPVSEAILREAFACVQSVLKEQVDAAIRKAGGRVPPPPPAARFDFAAKAEAKAEVRSEAEAEPELSAVDLNRYQKAMKEVDKRKTFQDRYNADPSQLARDEANPESDYNRELAAALGVEPAAAKKIRVRVAVTIKKLVERKSSVLVKHFQYVCPFCGGVDSPSCGYIRHSLEWKIQHSLKKPWNEEVTTTEMVEVDVETFEERDA